MGARQSSTESQAAWTLTTIGEQVLLQRGVDITRAEQRPGPVPVVSSGGVSSYHDTAIATGPGVILGRKGVVGSVWYLDRPYWPHDTSLWVKDFRGNHERFVYYYFKNISSTLAQLDVGSANPTLNRNHVHPLETTWPPLPEQRAIAHILGTLDDKIELNRRTNETLEAMARALFKSWFVDFDPVHAKKAGRKPEGMDAATAALFPSSFAGEIPKGWHRADLPSVIDMKEGPGIMAADFRASGVPLVRLAGLKSGVSVLAGCDYLDPDMVAKKWAQFALEPGDTLLSTSATLGLVTVVEEEGRGAIPYTGIIRMRSQPGGLTSRLIRHFLESRTFQEQVEAMGVGSVIRHFGPSHLKTMSIVVPAQAIQAAASDALAPIDAHVTAARRESATLAALRDALLPQLLSGSLRVPEAMRLVEKAL